MKNQYFRERNVLFKYFSPTPLLTMTAVLKPGCLSFKCKRLVSPIQNIVTTIICCSTNLTLFTGCSPGPKDLSILLTIWLFLVNCISMA